MRLTFKQLSLLLILLFAGFIRFWHLGTLPPGLYHDEAYNGLDALSLLRGEMFPQFYEGWELYAQDAHAEHPARPTRWPLFFEGNYGREPFHIYLTALSIALFGPIPFAVRFDTAVAGVLVVWATYLASTCLFGSRWQAESGSETDTTWLPHLAAFVVAILYPALTFSRFGLRMMAFVLVETLTIYTFWRAYDEIRPQRWLWFALTGALLGFGWYIYAVARLLPLLFVGFLPFWFNSNRTAQNKPDWRQVGMAFGLIGVTAVLVALPLLYFFYQTPYFFIFRLAYVSNKGIGAVDGKPWLTWLGNFGRVFAGLFWAGEIHTRHNLPGRPYLDPIQAFFFVTGIGLALRRWSQPRHVFLLLWLGVMLLPTLLSGDAPHFGRMSGIVPIAAILVALGANTLWQSLHTKNKRLAPLILAFLALSGLVTCYDYFIRYAQLPQLADEFYLPEWQLGQYIAAQPPNTSSYLTPTQEEMATIYFALNGDKTRLQSYSGADGALPIGKPGQPLLYAVRPSDSASLQAIQSHFPTAHIPTAQNNFIPIAIPPESPHPTPQHLSQADWGSIRLYGWSLQQQPNQWQITLYWQAQQAMSLDYTAYIHVLDSNGQIAAQIDQQPGGYPTHDWQTDEIILQTFNLNTSQLPPGTYQLQTGFYYLPTLQRLGDPAPLTTLQP